MRFADILLKRRTAVCEVLARELYAELKRVTAPF